MEKKNYTMDDLLEILRVLRGENGCPWDRVQTHETIKKSMIEEVYEAIDALDAHDDAAFANELGDVLLQVAFHAELARERHAFDFSDVLREICTKLITRHTHVFGKDRTSDAEEALGVWEKNKKKEKGQKTASEVIKDVPHSLPALMRAEKVQKKASSVGFNWDEPMGALEKVREETEEVADAIRQGDKSHIEEEFGDLLFSVAGAAYLSGVSAEIALANAINKFTARFTLMDENIRKLGMNLSDMSLPELDKEWEKAKKNL